MPDILRVNGIEVTFAKREVMNGIQQVGLPSPVIAYETIDLVGELKRCFAVILEVGQG